MATFKQKSDFHIIMLSVKGIKQEYKFHPNRKWRFDYYHPETKQAYEYEGIIAGKSRHTSLKGYTNDTEKYNNAAQMGIKVYRFTALNYQSVIDYLP
jgi:hypothetical protein